MKQKFMVQNEAGGGGRSCIYCKFAGVIEKVIVGGVSVFHSILRRGFSFFRRFWQKRIPCAVPYFCLSQKDSFYLLFFIY